MEKNKHLKDMEYISSQESNPISEAISYFAISEEGQIALGFNDSAYASVHVYDISLTQWTALWIHFTVFCCDDIYVLPKPAKMLSSSHFVFLVLETGFSTTKSELMELTVICSLSF